MSTIESLEQYISLINQLVAGELATSHFEMSYLKMFKNETREFPEDVYDVLNSLFTDVDAYCGDLELRDHDDLNDEELLSSAKDALEKLTALGK